MKKIIYMILLFTLASCSYINEKDVISKENVSLNTFLWIDNNNETQSWKTQNDLEQIKNLEINPDDIIWSWTMIENTWSDISEEDINELIDILFDKN